MMLQYPLGILHCYCHQIIKLYLFRCCCAVIVVIKLQLLYSVHFVIIDAVEAHIVTPA